MTDEIEQDFLEAEKATQEILEEKEAPFSGKSRFLGEYFEQKKMKTRKEEVSF